MNLRIRIHVVLSRCVLRGPSPGPCARVVLPKFSGGVFNSVFSENRDFCGLLRIVLQAFPVQSSSHRKTTWTRMSVEYHTYECLPQPPPPPPKKNPRQHRDIPFSYTGLHVRRAIREAWSDISRPTPRDTRQRGSRYSFDSRDLSPIKEEEADDFSSITGLFLRRRFFVALQEAGFINQHTDKRIRTSETYLAENRDSAVEYAVEYERETVVSSHFAQETEVSSHFAHLEIERPM